MIGEKFSEMRGKITNNRVVTNNKGEHTVETSFQGVTKLLGVECNEMGTYLADMRPSGTLYAEGNGIIMTKDGDTICWKGHGVGKPTGKGMAATWRASVSYTTTSTKFAKLNNILGAVEYECDENGNATANVWEWK